MRPGSDFTIPGSRSRQACLPQRSRRRGAVKPFNEATERKAGFKGFAPLSSCVWTKCKVFEGTEVLSVRPSAQLFLLLNRFPSFSL